MREALQTSGAAGLSRNLARIPFDDLDDCDIGCELVYTY